MKFIASLAILLFASSAFAEPIATTAPSDTVGSTQPATTPATQPLPKATNPDDKLSITDHRMTLDGQPFAYRATAGTLAIKGEDGKKKADLFFVAYEKSGVADPATRPITFVFNGGPGAAAVWLHIGTAGPMRIVLPEDGSAPAPPYKLTENQDTWLDLTDLVFIDPVATGFSRAAAEQNRDQFFGTDADISFLGDFLRLYLTRYNRWSSPKHLAGESYGTTRVAGLSDHLLDRHGISVNGVILISSVLDFQTISAGNGNDLPYAMYLPTYTATAWYHKKLPEELQQDFDSTMKAVEAFTSDEYLPALLKGSALSKEHRAELIGKLARYTGLSADTIERGNLRISPDYFRKQLLDNGRTAIGRFDARLKGFEPDALNSWPHSDPSFHGLYPVYAGTFNDYVRRNLGFESDLPYEILTNKVWPWDFGKNGQGYTRTADDLASALVKNPHLRVLFASGYYDLATPYYASNYTINHFHLTPELRRRISHVYYTAGHMMYHEAVSRTKLKQDLMQFFKN